MRVKEVLEKILECIEVEECVPAYDRLSDSYYSYPESKAVLGGMSNLEADKVFMDFIKTEYELEGISVEMMSFLHEVGHHMTFDYMEEDELIKSAAMEHYANKFHSYETYFKAPVEIVAAEWAVSATKNYYSSIVELDKELIEAIYPL